MPDLTTYEYDIFLSHNHADQEWTTKLAERLEGEDWQGRKLKVFFSPWDIRPGQSIPGKIEKALPKSRKVGLILSPEAVDSAWVELERLVTTYIAVSARDERLVPLYRRDCEIPALLQPILYLDFRDDANFEAAYQTLLSVVREEPLPRRSLASAGNSTVVHPLIPRPPIVGFVARRDNQGRNLIERLKEELAPVKNQLVALWGAGGVGKTTIAAEAVRSIIQANNQRVVWTTADGRANYSFSTLLDDIAGQLGRTDLRPLAVGPKEESLRSIIIEKPTLIILDNLETISPDEEVLCKEFLAHRAQCPALITTRERIDNAHLITIAAMSSDEATELLEKLIRQTHDPNIYSEVDSARILEAAEFNPLIIQWIVGQIDFAQDPDEVLIELAQGHGDAAERVFDRSFNLPQMAQGGRAVLLALSLFMPSAGRLALAEVSGMAQNKDKKKFKKAQQTLASLWLITQTNGGHRLAVEGLTRELANAHLSNDPRSKPFAQRYIARYLRFANAHSLRIPQDFNELEAEKGNLLNAVELAFASQNWKSVLKLMSSVAFPGMLDVRGFWDEAIRYGEIAINAAKALKDEWGVAIFQGHVATVRQNRGEYEHAKQVFQSLINVFERLKSEKSVATYKQQLGTVEHRLNNIDEAKRLYTESLQAKRQLGDQLGISIVLHNLAAIALGEKDLSTAAQLYDESLRITTLLNDQDGIAGTLYELGRLAQTNSDPDEAQRLYRQSLAITKTLGDQNGIARNLNQLGMLAVAQGDISEGERLIEEALSIFEKLMSPEAEIARRNLERMKGKSS